MRREKNREQMERLALGTDSGAAFLPVAKEEENLVLKMLTVKFILTSHMQPLKSLGSLRFLKTFSKDKLLKINKVLVNTFEK